ncbi:MAG: acylphosphatase [Actinomycetota bacterium]|nr:acylphosphatase [Actinomycetota bacterium]
MTSAKAIRALVRADALDGDLLAATVSRAHELGVVGWVRSDADSAVRMHAEGEEQALDELMTFLQTEAHADAVEIARVRREGHEQFAIRGVSAGAFVVQEHQATAHHFDLRLEVNGVMRSWAVPRGPSLDPAAKRLAVEVDDHSLAHNAFEGRHDDGGVIVWDHGTYEQGGRVAWPQAIDRGHAVFVLHGEKLSGGFALQRTRPGAKAQWLLIKRRDEDARPGSDVVAARPESVVSGQTLEEMLR